MITRSQELLRSALKRHAACDTAPKFVIPHSVEARSLSNSYLLSVHGNVFIVAFIISLLDRCGPFAISLLVRSIVVESLNAMDWRRAFSHVSKKCGEVARPFFTNMDASSAIVSVVRNLWVDATVFHLNPNLVFGRRLPLRMPVACAPVCRTKNAQPFSLIATAIRRESSFQVTGGDGVFCAAVATAKKWCAPSCEWKSMENDPMSKPLPNQIDEFHRLILRQEERAR